MIIIFPRNPHLLADVPKMKSVKQYDRKEEKQELPAIGILREIRCSILTTSGKANGGIKN